VAVVLLLLFGAPEQIVAGKYVQHSEEYLRLYPQPVTAVPEVLPKDAASLARLIEAGHATAALFEALGDALSAQGDSALAYRAYDRAQLLDPAAGVGLQRKKDRCEPVSAQVIDRERREAAIWVDALQSYERARIADGEDARALDDFYARYGRPEDDLATIVLGRQTAFWAGALGTGLALAFMIGAGRLRRRAAALPLAFAALALVGALRGGATQPYYLAAGALIVGAALVALRGRRAA
jgi:hypothetical protein